MADDLAHALLSSVATAAELDTLSFADKNNVDHQVGRGVACAERDVCESQSTLALIQYWRALYVQAAVGALLRIQAVAPGCLDATPVTANILGLTQEAKTMLEHGSHEARVFAAVPAGGIAQSELFVCI